MEMDDVDWEGEWIVLVAFALQFIYSVWLVVGACKGERTDMEISSIIFQFVIQYFYIWYFVQHDQFYAAIGIGILTFAAIIAFLISSYHRKKKIKHFHTVDKQCMRKSKANPKYTPYKIPTIRGTEDV